MEHGGPHSHAVIIARSLGIPMVGQVPGLIDQIKAGQLLRIDGTTGQIELDPSLDVMATSMAASPHRLWSRLTATVNARPRLPTGLACPASRPTSTS